MQPWDLAYNVVVLVARLQFVDDLELILPILQKGEGLRIRDVANDIEGVPLEPFSKIESLAK